MFGFFVGAALVCGAFAYSRRRRYARYAYGARGYGRGPAPGYGPMERGGWGGEAPWRRGPQWRMRTRGVERMAGWLAERLEASPEQYRVIRNEVEQFHDKTGDLRREMRLSRDDIAKAMRGDSFDEEIMGESFARQDDRIREVREQLVGALARIHDVLDERQRQRLAEAMDRMGGGWRGMA
ncbi:MAG: periplasmic heavy metal sensor [Myxococcota bacterium]